MSRNKLSAQMADYHETDNVVEWPKRLSQGPEVPSTDWLSKLPISTTFVSEEKHNTVFLTEYTIVNKKKGIDNITNLTLLRENVIEGIDNRSTQKWVNNEHFCNRYILWCVI